MEEHHTDEQEFLYQARESARNTPSDCSADMPGIVPDIAPPQPSLPCGDVVEEVPSVFVTPPLPPPPPAAPDLLPSPIRVRSQEAIATCPVGQSEISGATYPASIEAGAEVQDVYLDDSSPAISQSELFRVAAYSEQMQSYVDENLIAAVISSSFETFDNGFAAVTKLSLPVVRVLREALVEAQLLVDSIAIAAAESSIVCGWFNQELWVVCADNERGYSIVYTEPAGVEYAHAAAGEYTSEISQVDADTLAAVYAAFNLSCLVQNEEQVATCSGEGLLDESQSITWPNSWILPSIDPLTGNPITQTLESQGIATWGPAEWQDAHANTSAIPLDLLNGQEFMQVDQVGAQIRRTLRTMHVVAAATPGASAKTQELANAIAHNMAVLQLDCFVPNRPQIVSCITPVFGSAEAKLRADMMGRADTESGREAMHIELRGGDPALFGGPEYERYNVGIVDFSTPAESTDETLAFEVRVWPGLFGADSEASSNAQAGQFGAGYLQCSWISPEHRCACSVASPADAAQTYGLLHQQGDTSVSDLSGRYQQDPSDPLSVLDGIEGSPMDVKLDPNRSSDGNLLPRGLITSDRYPNATNTYGGEYRWPELPQVCQSSLTCVFVACKLACCEPKPDERPTLVNESPNFASTNSSWANGRQSDQADHLEFMETWYTELAKPERRIQSCALSDALTFDPVQYDECHLTLDESSLFILPQGDIGTSNAIVHRGPNGGNGPGMPARFKYGGLLKWGQTWAEPSVTAAVGEGGEPSPEYSPNGSDPNSLGLPGTVKACHNIDSEAGGELVIPDPWGFYHCAEGVAEGLTPFGLEDEARNLAVSRLVCTHVAWPRHLVLCPQHNQKPWGPVYNFDFMAEGSTTGEADQAAETMLLPLLECRDAHSYMLTFSGNKLTVPGASMAVVGKDECHPLGLSEAVLYSDCEEIADSVDIETDGGGHVIVYASCCEIDTAKKLFLKIVPDSSVTYEIIRDAQQKGELGIASGRETAETCRSSGSAEVYYIGSYHVKAMGGGVWQRITCQAHTGPIVLSDTCCGSSSSSDDSSDDSSSPSSDDSSSDDSSGPSSGGSGGSGQPSDSGSDKSTAIVPASWLVQGYTAVFTMESPEVVFRDLFRDVPITGRVTRCRIDPRFIEVCAPGTLRACGITSDAPVALGVTIDDGWLIITSPLMCRPKIAQVEITGVRKGFVGMRFPARDREQFEANEATLNSAYPAKKFANNVTKEEITYDNKS